MLILEPASNANLPVIEQLLKLNELPYEDIPIKLDSIFLGCIDSKILGIGGLEIHDRYGLLRSLVIAMPYRNKGYGRLFVNKLIEHARIKQIREVYLLTTATSFFSNIGFEQIERELVPPIIQNTSQFASLCPASAICLRKLLSR
jgi:amino-acid N-acetyltransferase